MPSHDMYNHHYILGLRSSLYHPPAGMAEGEGDEMEAERRQHARVHDHAPPSVDAQPQHQQQSQQSQQQLQQSQHQQQQQQQQQHRFPLPSSGGGRDAGSTLLRGQEQRRRQPRRPPAVGVSNSSSVPGEGGTELPLRWVSAAISEAAETIPLIQVFCEGACTAREGKNVQGLPARTYSRHCLLLTITPHHHHAPHDSQRRGVPAVAPRLPAGVRTAA